MLRKPAARLTLSAAFFLCALLAAGPAAAYMGPGAGLGTSSTWTGCPTACSRTAFIVCAIRRPPSAVCQARR